MAIDRKNIQIKLNAILNKNVAEIVAQKVYIPFLGNGYTEDDLRAWLKVRVDILQGILVMTDKQILNSFSDLNEKLTSQEKEKYISFKEDLSNLPEIDGPTFEKLAVLSLYEFTLK